MRQHLLLILYLITSEISFKHIKCKFMKKKIKWSIPRNKLHKLFVSLNYLFFGLLLFSATASASPVPKEKKITLEIKNSKLEDVIWEIRKQTGLVFLYSTDDVVGKRVKNKNFKNDNLDKVLNICLKESGLKFDIKNNRITILKKEVIVKKRKLSGTVRDNSGETLPGVDVLVKGTLNGVSTDVEGKFEITIPETPGIVLVFSFIGMDTKEVTISAQSKIDVILSSSSTELDEVVVTVSTGYQKIDRRLFTGSAVKIKAQDATVAGVADVGNMLEGKVAGVAVKAVSGTFGAAPKIRVRGASSIYGNQKPLWVIDGVVQEDIVDVSPDQLSSGDAKTLISSAVAGINTEDIESFEILKDASATALYGARAMNGVIVITTKKGHIGKTAISYSGEYTYRLKPMYSDYNIMNSKEQMSVYRELEYKGWLNHAKISRQSNGGIYKKMYDLINTYDASTGKFGLENTPEAKARFLQQYEMANTNWFDVLFTNNLIQKHSISISSGSEKSQTYFSLSALNDEGWSVGNNVKLYTANMRSNFKLNEKLKLGFSLVGSIRNQEAPGTLSKTSNVVDGAYSRDFDINPYSYALNTSRALRPYDSNGDLEFFRMNYAPFNIIHEIKNNYLELSVLDLKAQSTLNFNIMKGLDYNFVGSVRFVKTSKEHHIKDRSNMAMAYRAMRDSHEQENNRLLFNNIDDPNALAVSVLPKGGFRNKDDNDLLNFYFRNTINWAKTFDETHIVNLLGGQEVKYADRKNSGFEGVGYQWERGGVPFIDYRFLQKQSQEGQNYYAIQESYDRFVAFFGNGSYSYKGKYTFNGTYRYDGSNLLGQSKDSRWLPTWNVSGAWNIHTEEFLRNSKIISHLTLRATYGLTASMGAARNSSIVLYNKITPRPYSKDKDSQIYFQDLANKDLTWEKQYETNIGFDLGLLKNRISIQTDVYRRNGFDLIAFVKTSGIGGQFWKFANYADMKSEGLEFTLNTKNIKSKNFDWTTNITFSYNKNSITNLKTSSNIYQLTRETGGPLEGYPVRGLFSIDFKKLQNEGIPSYINQNGEESHKSFYFQSDNIKYLKYEGPVDPKYTGGMSNSFRYKGWTLNTFISYQIGNKIRLASKFKSSYTDLDAMPKEFINRWIVPSDNGKTNIPTILEQRQFRNYYTNSYNAYNLSTERVVDGSFVRLKELSIGYDVPKRFSDRLKLSSLKLKLQASNLCLIYADEKLNGQDPEFFGSGGVTMPVPKQFTFSLKIGL